MKFDIGDTPDGNLVLRFTNDTMQVMIGVTEQDALAMITILEGKVEKC